MASLMDTTCSSPGLPADHAPNDHRLDVVNKMYGLPNPLEKGVLSKVVDVKHDLENHLAQFSQQQRLSELETTRDRFGLALVLQMSMERKILNRPEYSPLPFLPRTRCSMEALTGEDESIDFKDVLNVIPEVMGVPQIMVERSLGMR